jgi:hypothetical protein
MTSFRDMSALSVPTSVATERNGRCAVTHMALLTLFVRAAVRCIEQASIDAAIAKRPAREGGRQKPTA